MIRPVKAKGNWDYSAREFPYDRIPPPMPMRGGRKRIAEWVQERLKKDEEKREKASKQTQGE